MALVPILILAAGASSRMGGADKLLQPVDGQSLLARRIAAATGSGQPVLVTLPAPNAGRARWQVVDGTDAIAVKVPDAKGGMANSLAAGIRALPPGAQGVLILLADMPDISGPDIRKVLAVFDGTDIVRGCAEDGTPGHPVVFPAAWFDALSRVSGDQGARDVLAKADVVRKVRLPKRHALTDLDTQEDWRRWRDSRKQH